MNSLFNILPEFGDKSMGISIMECEYNCDLALHNYITESSLLDSGIIVCESVDNNENSIETAKDNKFIQVIKAIAEAVRKLTTAFVDMIKNMGQKDDITYDDFMKSNTGQMQLSRDYAAINDKIEKEILEGRKIINLISRGTGVDPKIVATYCDKAGEATLKYGPTALSVASIHAIKKLTRRSIEKSCGEITSCEKELWDDITKKHEDLKRKSKELKYNDKYKDNPDKVQKKMDRYDKRQEISKVFNAMSKRQSKLVANAKAFINEVKIKANANNK